MSDPTLPANIREFHCYHCRGKIRIPRELPPTTAPCPHCKNIITSPAPEATASISPLPPAPAAYPSIPHHHVNESVPQTAQESPSGRLIEQPAAQPTYHTPTAPSPLEVSQVPQPITGASPSPAEQTAPGAVIPAPPTSGEQNQIEEPSSRSAPQQPSTAPTSLPVRGSSSRRTEPKEETKKSSTSAVPAIFLGCLLLSIAAGAGYLVYHEMAGKAKTPIPSNLPQNTSLSEGQYMRVGWKKDAYDVLGKFLAATTVEEKLPYIINGNQLRSQVEAFYGGSVINDQDTPIEAFSARELPDEDKKRGIFMLEFEQPPQFEMKEFFRPLATLEIQYGIDEANLLFSTMARVENFATAPVRATALFKKTPEGLKLDWETFAQTKYRTFANLVELPESGQGGVFRVIISEDVPESGRTLPPGIKTYRIWDPSAPETSTRVNVNIDSEIGRTLSKIDWRGKENRATNSTATIELKWVGTEQPKLEITRFICWEFLHLGGTETAAAPR
jgi:hypothetical protein